MANYDDFKKKAKDAFDTIADVSVEAYKLAEEKARVLAKKAKLNAGIANERATIRRLNVEIGATYYKLFKENPVEELKQQCEDVTAAYENIDAKKRELEELKNNPTGDDDVSYSCSADGATDNDENCGCGCDEHSGKD